MYRVPEVDADKLAELGDRLVTRMIEDTVNSLRAEAFKHDDPNSWPAVVPSMYDVLSGDDDLKPHMHTMISVAASGDIFTKFVDNLPKLGDEVLAAIVRSANPPDDNTEYARTRLNILNAVATQRLQDGRRPHYSTYISSFVTTMEGWLKDWLLFVYQSALADVTEAPEPRPDREEEIKLFETQVETTSPTVGTVWSPVSKSWYTKWKKYLGKHVETAVVSIYATDTHLATNADEPVPTPEFSDPIDNFELCEFLPGFGVTMKNMHSHYSTEKPVFLPESVFRRLRKWYGGGPMTLHPVATNIYNEAAPVPRPISLSVSWDKDRAERHTLYMWPSEKIADMIKKFVAGMSPDAQKLIGDPSGLEALRSYHYSETVYENDQTLYAAGITQHESILVQAALPPGKTRYEPGECGLVNLGNTCFMNSALQCLFNCTTFREEMMKFDGDSPTASALKDLLIKMWSGKHREVRPTDVRQAFSAKKREFASYAQQDAIEFLDGFLEVLHDELNPVKQKTYRERTDEDEKYPDDELSKLYWENYCDNNRSMIIDMFHGQRKTKKQCPRCDKVSVVFDGIGALPVSINKSDMHSLDVVVYACDGSGSARTYRVRVPQDSAASETTKELYRLTGAKPGSLVFARVHANYTTIMSLRPSQMIVKGSANLCAFHVPDLGPVVEAARDLKRKEEEAAKEQAAGPPAATPTTESDATQVTPLTGPETVSALDRDTESTSPAPLAETPPPSGAAGFLSTDDTAGSKTTHDASFNDMYDAQPIDSPEESSPAHESVKVCVGVSLEPMPVSYAASTDKFIRGMLVVDSSITGADLRERVVAVMRSHLPTTCNTVDAIAASKDWEFTDGLKNPIDPADTPLANARSTNIDADGVEHPTMAILRYRADSVEVTKHAVTEDETLTTVVGNKSVSEERLKLEDLLEEETQRYQLGEEDTWYCPRCKDHVRAYSEEHMFRLPKYLTIHLKRFMASNFGMTMRKLETEVEFPDFIDMAKYASGSAIGREAVYRLHGICNHSGSLAYGHYTAYVRRGDKWLDCNDQHVSVVHGSPSQSQAYMCFYERVYPGAVPMAMPAAAVAETEEPNPEVDGPTDATGQ